MKNKKDQAIELVNYWHSFKSNTRKEIIEEATRFMKISRKPILKHFFQLLEDIGPIKEDK